MKHLKRFNESADEGDKYLLNLSSANSMIGVERWISDYSNVSDVIKRCAISWSLDPMLDKLTRIPISARNLSNKEITDQIRVRGIRPMRLGQEYDNQRKRDYLIDGDLLIGIVIGVIAIAYCLMIYLLN